MLDAHKRTVPASTTGQKNNGVRTVPVLLLVGYEFFEAISPSNVPFFLCPYKADTFQELNLFLVHTRFMTLFVRLFLHALNGLPTKRLVRNDHIGAKTHNLYRPHNLCRG